MKHFVQIFLVTAIVIVFGVSACAPKADAPVPELSVVTEEATTEVAEVTPTESPTVVSQETEVASTEATTIDVEALILDKLNNKHSIARVFAAQKTREEWNITLDRMIGYGAKISEEEKQIIIDFLLSR
jgi:hypothetical protein